jgi:hypothetical protein
MEQRLRHGMKDREFVMNSKAMEEFSLPRSVQPAHSAVGTLRASKNDRNSLLYRADDTDLVEIYFLSIIRLHKAVRNY